MADIVIAIDVVEAGGVSNGGGALAPAISRRSWTARANRLQMTPERRRSPPPPGEAAGTPSQRETHGGAAMARERPTSRPHPMRSGPDSQAFAVQFCTLRG